MEPSTTAPVAAPSQPSATAPFAAPLLEAPATEPRHPFVYKQREIPPSSSLPSFSAAIGSNPVGWLRGSFAASLYVGLSQHHALRANFAYYDHHRWLQDVASAASGAEGVSYRGRVIDYGVSWVHYSTKRWEGFTLEAGALLRDRAIRDGHEDEVVKNWSTTFAARGMIGYSWRFGPTFLAAAVGLSGGYEKGRETVKDVDSFSMPATERQLARLQADGEAYLRMGFVIGD